MTYPDRPLSPHLQVYRWYVTMATSILHRATGVFLAVGALAFLWWLLALASGPAAFATVKAFWGAWYGRVILLGISWSVMFHLLNGIRHLVWDIGHGFEIETARRSGIAVIVLSVILTLVLWGYGYWAGGAWL